ncbi:hypothetical protein [Clostridioides sp. ZZV15-6597]|uniref:hypothetical protein n=1 Tax=Clostridioides sp. ZZV15-6597 TaxID=2811500 RepID=UPI001D11A2DA|nr:hypothetical protein [Clostridioides sp. ZZV15-6597]HBF1820548.1 hypothetical protein [Clostridioides difficile]
MSNKFFNDDLDTSSKIRSILIIIVAALSLIALLFLTFWAFLFFGYFESPQKTLISLPIALFLIYLLLFRKNKSSFKGISNLFHKKN